MNDQRHTSGDRQVWGMQVRACSKLVRHQTSKSLPGLLNMVIRWSLILTTSVQAFHIINPQTGEVMRVSVDPEVKARAIGGDPRAAFQLYGYYTCETNDLGQAEFWLRKAAAGGYVAAQNTLGKFLLRIRRDEEAWLWFRQAANNGYAEAQYHLGQRYAQGWGVERNVAVARIWYEKAAYGANTLAMDRLAELDLHGIGGNQDDSSAYVWMTVAAMRRADTVPSSRDEQKAVLRKRLSTSEIERAEQKARAIVETLATNVRGGECVILTREQTVTRSDSMVIPLK